MTSRRDILKIVSVPVLVASLCCLAPVILVLFGLSTVAFAASLTDVLYGQYKWAFRLVGLVMLAIAVIVYLRRRRGICTMDEVKRRRNEVINVIGLVFIAGVLGYIVWLYVVVELIGLALGIWS